MRSTPVLTTVALVTAWSCAVAPRPPASESRPEGEPSHSPKNRLAPESQAPAPAQAHNTSKQAIDGSPQPSVITIVAGGDVTLGYHYEEYFDQQVNQGRTREEMFAHGFAQLRQPTAGADIFVVNLECPFTARGEKLEKNFNFRARPELVAALAAGGVHVVSLANNHMMDYGPVGLFDTLETLDHSGIPHFGAGRTLSEARKPAILAVGATRVAFLGYFFLGDHNIEPPQVLATDSTPGVAGTFRNENAMTRMLVEDIQAARSHADLVIPFFHWGREGHHEAEPYQVRLAQAAVSAGASMVLGSHPHVLQGMEVRDGVPVIYSLGNLVFGGNWNPQPKEAALVRVRFTPRVFGSMEVIPLHTDKFPEVPIQPYPVDGVEAEEIYAHLADYSREFPHPLLQEGKGTN